MLAPKTGAENAGGVLWSHGGGYIAGMKEMVHASRVVDLVKKFGAVVVSPGYRLAVQRPYPAAAEDCYSALIYMKNHVRELGIRRDQIMVGGESAGGGLCAAGCIRARDTGEVNVAFQMPLYPMLDDRPTKTSKNNDAPVWNTKSNIAAWKLYLGGDYGTVRVSNYAAPARETDFSGLPPTLTFIGSIDPFLAETQSYVDSLRAAGVPVEFRIFEGGFHSFDI